MKNAGLAVIIDIGEPGNIHPPNKLDTFTFDRHNPAVECQWQVTDKKDLAALCKNWIRLQVPEPLKE